MSDEDRTAPDELLVEAARIINYALDVAELHGPAKEWNDDLESWWVNGVARAQMEAEDAPPVTRPVPQIAHFLCTPTGLVLDPDKPQPDYL